MKARFVSTRRSCVNLLGISALVACGLAASSVRAGTTLFVANNGSDSTTCGSATSPCRSVSQAIHNAGNGDIIIVGSGVYGDVDQSGFSGLGDEAGPNTSCNCMINIDKDVTIVSRDGASATILDAAGNGIDGVAISASGATLGGLKKGFTVIGAGGNGVTISNGLSGAVVIGNRSDGNGGDGFLVSDSANSNQMRGNIAINNGNNGFEIRGTSNVIAGNAATANSRDGFHLLGTGHTLSGNLASDNGRIGFDVLTNSTVSLVKNAAIANLRFGIVISSNATGTIEFNDIFGNNESPVNSFGTNGLVNVGLVNDSFGKLTVSGNYYGAPTGPGADPADTILDIGAGSATTNLSIGTKEIRIKAITP
ncbi:MAG TPA: right-handed parallel beta-helix repeat-containing protein [Verrucomicrobiae bacterium]|nr:right-handed parallel beta-helix repeat-containing protein [Verrucomicrobiae bacterium]